MIELEDGLQLQLIAWLTADRAIEWRYHGARDERIEALSKNPTSVYTEAFAVLNQRLNEVMALEATAANEPPESPIQP